MWKKSGELFETNSRQIELLGIDLSLLFLTAKSCNNKQKAFKIFAKGFEEHNSTLKRTTYNLSS